jgi:hypothetical protein
VVNLVGDPTTAYALCRACSFGHPNECESPAHCNRRSTAVPTRYRKKPVVIDAHQWDGDDAALDAWLDALGVEDGSGLYGKDDGLCIDTLEGTMTVSLGDWIIRGVQGEFYPCKPDIFKATYEPVSTPQKPERRADCMAVGEGIDGTALLCDRVAGHDGAHHCPVSGATWGERTAQKPEGGA